MVSNEPKKKRWNCEISKFQKKNPRLPFVHYISLYILLILPQFYLAEQLHLSVATWLDGSRDGQPSASWALRKAYVGSEWIEEKKKLCFRNSDCTNMPNPSKTRVSSLFQGSTGRWEFLGGLCSPWLARLTHETRPEGHHTVPVAAACVTPAEGAWQFWPVGCLKMVDSPKKATRWGPLDS